MQCLIFALFNAQVSVTPFPAVEIFSKKDDTPFIFIDVSRIFLHKITQRLLWVEIMTHRFKGVSYERRVVPEGAREREPNQSASKVMIKNYLQISNSFDLFLRGLSVRKSISFSCSLILGIAEKVLFLLTPLPSGGFGLKIGFSKISDSSSYFGTAPYGKVDISE